MGIAQFDSQERKNILQPQPQQLKQHILQIQPCIPLLTVTATDPLQFTAYWNPGRLQWA